MKNVSTTMTIELDLRIILPVRKDKRQVIAKHMILKLYSHEKELLKYI